MAESKSIFFRSDFNARSENCSKIDHRTINRLPDISECGGITTPLRWPLVAVPIDRTRGIGQSAHAAPRASARKWEGSPHVFPCPDPCTV
jgi:hypothetical protein